MLLSVVSDPRLVLARLARQLVDLNAAKDGHAATRERLALETREVFAPLANRLGLWQLKWELEDLAFRFLQPDDYRRIAAALAEKRADRERYIAELCRTLEDMLRGAGIDAEVYGRPKHIYSIHRKMERKQLTFEQVFDLRAVRIVTRAPWRTATRRSAWCMAATPTSPASSTTTSPRRRTTSTAPSTPRCSGPRARPSRCRSARARCTTRPSSGWPPIGATRNRARTTCPTTARSSGCASCSTPSAAASDRDFLDEVRAELFEDRVYALTPKGEVVDLPPGATPLDFAYHVHTDLGHRCRGARVNGRIVPLTRALANGEIVEIITHKHPQPSRDWLSETQGFLVTPAQPLQGARLVPEVRRGRRRSAAPRPKSPRAGSGSPRRRAARNALARSCALAGGPGRRRGPADQLCALLRAGEARAHRRLRDRRAAG